MNADKYLKTRKIREAEEAARRSRITKVLARLLTSLGFIRLHTLLMITERWIEFCFWLHEKENVLIFFLIHRLLFGYVSPIITL